jgi:hypothetical protein
VSPYAIIATGFGVVFGGMLAVELLARSGRGPFLPVAEALHAVLLVRLGRWLIMLGWLWTGFHFLAR